MVVVRKLGPVAMTVLALMLAACTSAQTIPPTTQGGVPSTTGVTPTTLPAQGYSLAHASVVLDTDVAVDVQGCPAALNNAPPVRSPSNGLRIDTGPAFLSVQTFRFASGDCLKLHGMTACPATAPDYSILVLRVSVPGRSKPVFVSIGLAGDGMVARAILYSLRAA